MTAPFAKLFDTASGQLLAYMSENADDPAIVVVGALINELQPSATLSYHTVAQRDAAFELIDQDKAEGYASALAGATVGL